MLWWYARYSCSLPWYNTTHSRNTVLTLMRLCATVIGTASNIGQGSSGWSMYIRKMSPIRPWTMTSSRKSWFHASGPTCIQYQVCRVLCNDCNPSIIGTIRMTSPTLIPDTIFSALRLRPIVAGNRFQFRIGRLNHKKVSFWASINKTRVKIYWSY